MQLLTSLVFTTVLVEFSTAQVLSQPTYLPNYGVTAYNAPINYIQPSTNLVSVNNVASSNAAASSSANSNPADWANLNYIYNLGSSNAAASSLASANAAASSLASVNAAASSLASANAAASSLASANAISNLPTASGLNNLVAPKTPVNLAYGWNINKGAFATSDTGLPGKVFGNVPWGIQISSEGLLVDGTVAVSGIMPFESAVAVNGMISTVGNGIAACGCGNTS